MKPTADRDSEARIGPAAERLGLSPRMVRYLEEQGVLRPERGPGPRGHRHFPPPELALAAAAVRASQAGHPSATLRAFRDLGARRVHLPVIDGAIDVEALTTAVRSGDLAALPEGLLVSGTARIATEFPDQWAVLLDHFLANPGEATLIHCTGGKDRTGWAAALVLRALGVAPDVVLEDYVLSNDCLADRTAVRIASVRSTVAANLGVPEDAVDLGGLPGLLGVRPTYRRAAFDAVDAEHGSFDTYLTDALGCSVAKLTRLRDNLLE